jgi:hypothetical protein
MVKTKWGLVLTGAKNARIAAFAAVVLGVIGILGLSASGSVPFGLARVVFVQPESTPAWAQRIAIVDEALGRSDLSRAIYEWREAYSAALSSRRSDGLIAVGDRAIRIAERTGGSGFARDAREVYVHAAYRARAERSRDTVLGIAEVLEKLGDTERAEQVRRIAASMS